MKNALKSASLSAIFGGMALSGQHQKVRLIHYLEMEGAKPEDFEFWRAGAHTDFDCLTLLHQREGQWPSFAKPTWIPSWKAQKSGTTP